MTAWRAAALCVAVGAAAPTDDDAFRRALLETHCVECHGPERQRGDFRADTTPYDLATPASRARWREILEHVDGETMPPPEASRAPSRAERDRLVAAIRADLDTADDRDHATLGRRLTRVELLHTVRDLFGVRGIDLPRSFPEDVTDLPFDTMTDGLFLSAAHLGACLELAADVAERMVYVPDPPQVTSTSGIDSWSQESSLWTKHGDASSTYLSGVNNAAWCGAVWDRAFVAPTSGTYLVHVLAGAEGGAGADGAPLRLGFYALTPGDYYMPESANRVDLPRVGVLDVTARALGRLTARVELEKGESFHVYCENRLPPTDAEGALNRLALTERFMAATKLPLPTIRVARMTVTGPVAPLPRQAEFLGGRDGEEAVRAVLLPLAARAFRRPLDAHEERELVRAVMEHVDATGSLERGLRFGIRRVLLAPAFLHHAAPDAVLRDHALADRVASFLWSSLPDDELRALASTGALDDPDVLRAQVVRMLADPRGSRFVRDFTGQWLGNRRMESLMVCDVRHAWNEVLRYGYIRSSELFFDEVLRTNASIRTFIDSDFTYANLPMRMTWRFPGDHPDMALIVSDLTQSHIRPEPERLDLTDLPRGVPDDVARRGGVLGLPSVLTLTGDGVESSPILRGVWVLENLYGMPPPPPPDDVPALAATTSGATSVRERLAAHRASASCASCHARIDPLGLALENYDAAGNWRAAYRTRPRDDAPRVDATATLPDGTRLTGPQDVKRHLLAHSALFTRCLTTKLLEYATGRHMTVDDTRAVRRIVRDEPRAGYGFRDLVVAVVRSEAFRRR